MDLEINAQNKFLVDQLWKDLGNGRADSTPVDSSEAVLARALVEDVVWHGFSPIGSLVGVEAITREFWKPFKRSFAEVERETHLFFGGESNGRVDGDITKDGRMWVTGTGLFHGRFVEDYLGIKATGGDVSIRWGEFCCVEDGAITEVYFLIDLIDLMQQAGFAVLPPSLGAAGLYPAPAAGDGLVGVDSDSQPDIAQTAYSLDHIRRFIFEGLNAYDEDALESMGMADWFHPDVRWYGPGGIGACLSFAEFEQLHQAPWLVAFPDRQVQDLDALFAEGLYTGAPGWAGVKATHTGVYLDQPATGNSIDFNGLDWWKRDGETYIENWVFVDMIHLFEQFGVDLMERMKSGA